MGYKHKYKHGKPNEEWELKELEKTLAKKKLSHIYKAYVYLLYWLGCRRSEPLVILKEDVEEIDGNLFVSIHFRRDKTGDRIPYSRAKRGQAGGPTKLPLSKHGVPLIKEVWENTRKGQRLFPFCDKTGYRIIKKLAPKRTPHWLRYNRLTKLRKKRENGKITIDDIKSFTGIRRDSTIEGYGMKTKVGIHKVAQVLD